MTKVKKIIIIKYYRLVKTTKTKLLNVLKPKFPALNKTSVILIVDLNELYDWTLLQPIRTQHGFTARWSSVFKVQLAVCSIVRILLATTKMLIPSLMIR